MRLLISALTLAAFAITACAPAYSQGAPATWRYDMVDGVATATYPGNVAVAGNVAAPISTFGNPTLPGGLIGPADGISTTSQIDTYNLTGTRTLAAIGRSIEINDAQIGPESGPSTPTPASASYGLSIVGSRPAWATSTITGEMDGISILLRQARSDVAAILSNVGVQSGFASTLESYTFAADATGTPTKGIRVQLGMANPRDNTYMGLGLAAENGTNLNAGLNVYSSNPAATWLRYVQVLAPDNSDVFYIRGSDGVVFTKSIAPVTDYAGDLGANTLHFSTAFLRNVKLDPLSYGSLNTFFPCNSTNLGRIFRVSDASVAVTTFNQIISAGGGANTALVTCDGANWRALSS